MIAAKGIYKAYGPVELFAGLELEVKRGESVALTGASGAGKTTLLRLLGGLALPDRGEVEIDGRRLTRMSSSERAHLRAERIGFVFQGDNLLPHLSVLENVTLPGAFRSRPLERSVAEAALAKVGLQGCVGHLASTLSGGEAQRVAVARAVAERPDVLLCDEPTGSLDTDMSRRVAALLVDSAREMGCALVLATHETALADLCARRVSLVRGERGGPGV